jgi:excisionase family DNA binding protein
VGTKNRTSRDHPIVADLSLLGEGRLVTVDEVAHVLNVDRRRVYVLRDAGLLPGFAIGRSIRFAPSAVLDLLVSCQDDFDGFRAT